jgi:hypothetical protein
MGSIHPSDLDLIELVSWFISVAAPRVAEHFCQNRAAGFGIKKFGLPSQVEPTSIIPGVR